MKKLSLRTQKAIFAMQDLRNLSEQGKELVDKYCSVSYTEILERDATNEHIEIYTARLETAICLLGENFANRRFALKLYDLDTIQRLQRLSDFIHSQNNPIYIKLNQRVQYLITKYNMFYNYSEDLKRFYSNSKESFENKRIRLFNLFLDIDSGNIILEDLSISDLKAIEDLIDEWIEITQKVIEKYECAIEKEKKKLKNS